MGGTWLRRTGGLRGEVESAVYDPFCDPPQGEVVLAGMDAGSGERVVHQQTRGLKQHSLCLLDEHAAVQRALQLLGDKLRLGEDALLEYADDLATKVHWRGVDGQEAPLQSRPLLSASRSPPARASKNSVHSVTRVCRNSRTSYCAVRVSASLEKAAFSRASREIFP